ncbi:MAG: enolase C-terminal domain-like protein [Candidatus Zixiibacteriota bacterium]
MMNIDTCKVSLPLKKKFVVSKGEAQIKTNLLTILNNRYSGEAAGSVHYGPSVEAMEAEIIKGIKLLKKSGTITAQTLNEINSYNIHPVARSAIMGMVLNFLSGESQRYPWEILEIPKPVGIKSSFTISIDTPAEMIKAINESPFPIIKVKMGNEDDVQLVDAFKAIKGKEIRVDANGGWSPAKAEEMIYFLSRNGIKIIEQPTDADHVGDWPHVKGKAVEVELILDEGLNTLEDYARYAESIDGVNIKMEKCGGIIEGIKIAQAAQEEKKKVMLGCMVESSVGIAQSVYMSSLADYCDLDGPQLLENDIASGIMYQKELIEVDREIIGGPKLKRDLVDKYTQP